MNIYLISQKENNGYDTFDSAVVCADCEDQARDMHPRKQWDMTQKPPGYVTERIDWNDVDELYSEWATKRENVKVTLIGKAAPGTPFGVICASFNAG